MTPKVFISYSWSSQVHQQRVMEWGERLMANAVDVVLDLYDLKEGYDKYAFMERMVADPQITHVLIISDKTYSEKADARKAGVGTESQIISKEVYEKVDQSKFVPIVCEFADDGTPFLPTFLKSRIYIDFSSPEAVNENWERLIRLLFGKPFYEKPTLGKPPAYISQGAAAPSSPALGKYNALLQAILHEKKGINLYRQDFLDACIEYADSLRVRQRPQVDNFASKVLEDCGKLVQVRDHIIDWVLLESAALPSTAFSDALIDLLERLRELKTRPPEVTQWSDAWFEAQGLFVYETFLYIIAALLKTHSYDDLHNIFSSHYLLPSTERYREQRFTRFDDFYAHSETLNAVLAPKGKQLYSPAAELVKRQAQRADLPFTEIIQADLLALMMAFITPDVRWYPQIMHYWRYQDEFPFFIRASQHKNFKNLATITGIGSADALRTAVKAGYERMGVGQWQNFHFEHNFWEAMNMSNLDTIT